MEEQKIYICPPAWLPVTVALILGLSFGAGKFIETREREPVIIGVQGEGLVQAVPNIAELRFGVSTGRASTAGQAMKQLSERMQAIVAAMQKQGVAETDVRTEGLSLQPSYDYRDGERIDQGYEAQQSLVVRVRDLEKLGVVLEAAVEHGANQVGGVTFTFDDPALLRAEARGKAIEDAKEKGRLLAFQLGKTLGEIKGYSEGGGVIPAPFAMRAMESDKGGGIPLPPGEQDIRVEVTLQYKLD